MANMPDVPTYPGFLLVLCVITFCYGCYLISQAYWARQRARGPAYWQAILDGNRGGPQFLDYRCDYCSEEEHDICWDWNPDLDCVCCKQTLTKDGGWAAGSRRYGGGETR